MMTRAVEEWYRASGARVEWGDDWSLGMSHRAFYGDAYDTEPQSCEHASVWLGRDCLASLGCIDDADEDYRREIEAELIDEAYRLILSDLGRI